MKNLSKYFVLFLSMITLLFIAFLFYTSSGITPEIKEVKNLSIKKITNSQIELKVKILAENSSIFSYDIRKMSLNVLHEKDTIGIINSDTTISFSYKSQNEFDLAITLKTEKVAELLQKDIDTIKLNMFGTAKIKLLFFEFDNKINVPFNLPLKESIFNTIQEDTNEEKIITIKSTRISKVGVTKSQLLINFQLTNPYDIDFTLIDYPSQVFINNNYAGEGSLQYPISVDTLNKTNDGTFVFDLNNFDTITSLFSSIFKGKIEYTTKGTLLLEILNYKVRIPYSFNGVIE